MRFAPAVALPYFAPLRSAKHLIHRNVIRNSKNIFPIIRNFDRLFKKGNKFEEMNKRGIYSIEDRKCNFDVEMGRDILLDHERNNVDTFVLWSGDSDFAEPVEKLLDDGKKVLLFATARRVSTELNNLQDKGLFIFDIQKIKTFICWKREITMTKSKRDPFSGAPKL